MKQRKHYKNRISVVHDAIKQSAPRYNKNNKLNKENLIMTISDINEKTVLIWSGDVESVQSKVAEDDFNDVEESIRAFFTDMHDGDNVGNEWTFDVYYKEGHWAANWVDNANGDVKYGFDTPLAACEYLESLFWKEITNAPNQKGIKMIKGNWEYKQ